jgi:hypothetical protein
MSAPMMKCKSASLTAQCLKFRELKSTWTPSMERAGDQTFSLGVTRARVRASSLHQCQKRPNVGLFCSLLGLFFLYIRPLLTLMHTLGESLVTSAQADNIGIVSDILRDGCAYLSPPSPEEKKKVAPVNASYQDIFGQTALHCAAINGNLEMVNQKKTIIEQIGGN